MAPMIQGVPDGQGQCLGPLLELLPIGCVAGDIFLVHAEGAHEPPLVVVAPQPDLGDVLELPVLVDLPGDQMAVVVDDGHGRREIVVEMPGGGGVQQKILIHKGLHV